MSMKLVDVARQIMTETISAEHVRATNRIDHLVSKIFDKYGIDQARTGTGNLVGKRIVNAISSEIANAILEDAVIVQLIKMG